MMRSVDLNCDMGEGYANDRVLMDYVSSVNVACGFHAGDADTMRATVDAALEKSVAVGAHPSFPDREHFGRRDLTLSPGEVYSIVAEQINIFRAVCETAGTHMGHVKPHGALYNLAARDHETAEAIAKAVYDIDPRLILYGLSGSNSISAGDRVGLRTASEVFADRTYQADGSLTPRKELNALITHTAAAAAQALAMVRDGIVVSVSGEGVAVRADTICIHGDGPQAVQFAAAISSELKMNNIRIEKPYV